MKFPKTLVFVTIVNLTVATEFACAQIPTPQPAATAAPLTVPTTANAPAASRTALAPAQAAAPAAPANAVDAEDIRDVHGPISIPYEWLWAAYVAGGLALAAAAYAGWRWYRRHARESAKFPHEIALERLEKARALMTEPQAREYSFAVSEITRRYIESRFHERAARHTTEEFLHGLLARTDTPLAAYRESLEDVLNHCDLAKFARWQLSVPDMEAMHESARTFILETRPAAADAKTPVAGSRNGNAPHTTEPQLTHS